MRGRSRREDEVEGRGGGVGGGREEGVVVEKGGGSGGIDRIRRENE